MLSGDIISTHKDIEVLSVNTKGRDLIIADVHGNSACLASIIDELKLTDDDRLFIAGDLVDRGPDSVGVISLLQNKKNVYVVRGNHEFMSLDTIIALEIIVKELLNRFGAKDFREKCNDFQSFVKIVDELVMQDAKALGILKQHVLLNAGRWLMELFHNDLMADRIVILPDKAVQYDKNCKTNDVWEYISQLPYLMRVAGNDKVMPFCIVHSDMPINDAELSARIAKNQPLTFNEKFYAVWSRHPAYNNGIGRNECSDVAYCGHEVILRSNVECIRRSTSHVNLDNASFLVNVALVVDHTNGQVLFVGPDKKILDDNNNAHRAILLQRMLEVKAYVEERRLDFELTKIKTNFVTEILTISDNELFREKYKSVTLQICSEIDKFNNERFNNFCDDFSSFDLANHVVRSISNPTQMALFIDQFKYLCKKEMINDIKSINHKEEMENMVAKVKAGLNKLIEVNNSLAGCAKLELYTVDTLVAWVIDMTPPAACVSQAGLFSGSCSQRPTEQSDQESCSPPPP